MRLSRRALLQGAGALPLAAGSFGFSAFAQTAPAAPSATEIPPIVFAHGNGEQAPLWMTTLWRMESNGVPRDGMLAINFTDPLGRADDTKPEPNKSSTEDQRRELSDAVRELKRRTGAPRIALVGNSRGGYPIRNYIKNGGGGDISHAVLCGVPNHGVYDWDANLGYEFNGRGPFLRALNDGESEVTAGTSFLTLRSDSMDKYAQPDGHVLGKPGTPTGVSLRGTSSQGRNQSGARRGRPSRDRVSSARLPRDLQIHRRPRTGADRDYPGSGSQIERRRDRHAGRRPNQPPGDGRIGGNLSRVSR